MIDCDGHIINDDYWDHIPIFVKKEIIIEHLDVKILGYFPYHTARLRPIGISQSYLPRNMFESLELELAKNHILDNKAVYICKSIRPFTGVCPFALMFKDDYVMIGVWSSVVNYDNKSFKLPKQ